MTTNREEPEVFLVTHRYTYLVLHRVEKRYLPPEWTSLRSASYLCRNCVTSRFITVSHDRLREGLRSLRLLLLRNAVQQLQDLALIITNGDFALMPIHNLMRISCLSRYVVTIQSLTRGRVNKPPSLLIFSIASVVSLAP